MKEKNLPDDINSKSLDELTQEANNIIEQLEQISILNNRNVPLKFKILESEMDGDEYNGELKEYYQNGNLKSKENFDKGVLDGKYEYYFGDGLLRQSGCITNTLKNGEILSYYEDGTLKSLETYILGIRSGPQKYFYDVHTK